MRCSLDHLVLGCADLAQGCAAVERALGVAPVPGGRHALMGTHNALLRLGPREYLEVLAIDPDAPAPARPRFFGLDEPAMQARLAAGPALIAWVARTDALAQACARVPELGEPLAMARGDFRWQIAVPADGALQWSGVLPLVIEWQAGADGVTHHPCDRLPESGCTLARLALTHPLARLGAAGIIERFRQLRIDGAVDLGDGPIGLRAHIDAARGRVSL